MICMGSMLVPASVKASTPKVGYGKKVPRPLVCRTRKGPQRTIAVRSNQGDDGNNMLRNVPDPEDARGAIAVGLELTEAGEWERALSYFETALSLPGTGIKRFRDKPPAISDGEKIASLYNIACCLSNMGGKENLDNGLVALAGCLEAGYDNFEQLRIDPDLAELRKDDRFEGLLKRFDRKGGFLGMFKSL